MPADRSLRGRGRLRGRWRLALTGLIAVAGQALVALALPTASVACVPAKVPFDRVVDRAGVVIVADLVARTDRADGRPEDSFALVARIRGSHEARWAGPAPTVAGCETWLDAAIGQRLVLAVDVTAFDAAAPITVAWFVQADGTVEPHWALDEQRIWPSVEALARAFGARAVIPASTPEPAPPEDPDVPGLLATTIVAAVVLTAGLVVLLAIARRPRRSRPG